MLIALCSLSADNCKLSTKKKPGDDLLSQPLAGLVPSALEGLTAVFGMGTGVSPPPNVTWNLYNIFLDK